MLILNSVSLNLLVVHQAERRYLRGPGPAVLRCYPSSMAALSRMISWSKLSCSLSQSVVCIHKLKGRQREHDGLERLGAVFAFVTDVSQHEPHHISLMQPAITSSGMKETIIACASQALTLIFLRLFSQFHKIIRRISKNVNFSQLSFSLLIYKSCGFVFATVFWFRQAKYLTVSDLLTDSSILVILLFRVKEYNLAINFWFFLRK